MISRRMKAVAGALAVVAAAVWVWRAPAEPGAGQPEVTEWVMMVEAGLPERTLEAAGLFSQQVHALSRGKMRLQLVETDNPLERFYAGECDLYLASGQVMAGGSSDFLIYTSPFYFSGYDQGSMTLGSEGFAKLMQERMLSALWSQPLAVLYGGSFVLASAKGPVSTEEPPGDNVYVRDERVGFLLERLGFSIRNAGPPESVEAFNNNRAFVLEMPLEELGSLSPPQQQLYVMQTPVRTQWFWLMAGETVSRAGGWERAILQEAASAARAWNDQSLRQCEQEALDIAQGFEGGVYAADWSLLHEQARQVLARSSRYINAWDWSLYQKVTEIMQP